MHHNIFLRFEVFLTFNYSTSKIANHNKYIMNRNSIKQKKAEDILSSCLFCKNWERFYLQKMFALRTIVFILFLCYNYLSCMSHRNFAELLPGRADQWRLSSFRQALFLHLPSYIFLPDFML